MYSTILYHKNSVYSISSKNTLSSILLHVLQVFHRSILNLGVKQHHLITGSRPDIFILHVFSLPNHFPMVFSTGNDHGGIGDGIASDHTVQTIYLFHDLFGNDLLRWTLSYKISIFHGK